MKENAVSVNYVEKYIEDKNKHLQTLENACFLRQQPIGESNPCSAVRGRRLNRLTNWP